MQALRSKMRNQRPEIDAYIVTTFDEHQTHEDDGKEGRLQFISGFTGPIADAAVSETKIFNCHGHNFFLSKDHHEISCSVDGTKVFGTR
jgi:hypothetical protein